MLLKADEAAKILAVNRARLYQLVRESAVPYVRLGERQIRFSEPALQEWIASGGLARRQGQSANGEKAAAA